ncbi:ABC transporter with 2x AAA and 11+ transmembrane domains [Cryptosporidium sp. chipmunk genotype I]|uniref:ABC transporter with 2x AAA and 11+ transmembrane domains n=1 Tax=Cryptosporidium sp. chipmunk genotype I TaxID=1280935 RepID=UPI00351A3059|nr:ABC transporter with 2x AAA and 11+ transmembrane domains [Cryptosporidium sp. chipmunk genotype I]
MQGGSSEDVPKLNPKDHGSIYKPKRWFYAFSPRYLSFGFISPYMKLKDTELMKEEDLPEIPSKDNPFILGRHLEEALRREERNAILGKREPSLMRALLGAYYPFIIICIFSLTVIDVIRFSVGFIIKSIVADLQKPMPLKDTEKMNSVINFLLVFLIMLFSSISIPHIVFFQYRYIFRIYSSLATNILWRGLKKSGGLLVRKSIDKNGLIPPTVMDMKLIKKINKDDINSRKFKFLSPLSCFKTKSLSLKEIEMKDSLKKEENISNYNGNGNFDDLKNYQSHAIRLNYINIYNVMMGDLFPCSILLGNLISVILFPLRVLLASYAISIILNSSLPNTENHLGWIINVSLISCISTLTLFISISAIFQIKSGFLRKPLFFAKDCRLDELRYILSNIRTIKLLNWESFVYRNLVELRTYEMYWRGRRLWLSGFSEIFSFCSSYFSQAILFTSLGLLFKKYFGQFSIPATATVPIIFSLNTLFTSVNMLPDELGYVVQGFVSLGRIQTFLFSRIYDYPILKDREFIYDQNSKRMCSSIINKGKNMIKKEDLIKIQTIEKQVIEEKFQKVALWYINATFVRQIYDDPVYRYLHQIGYLRSCGGMDLVYKQIYNQKNKQGNCILDIDEIKLIQEKSQLVNMTTLTEIASFKKKSSFDKHNIEKILRYFQTSHENNSLGNWDSFDFDINSESDFKMLGKLNPCLIDLNIKVEYGEICFIIGDHGSGKTTFIEAILGDLFRIRGDTYLGTEINQVNKNAVRNIDIINSNPWIPFGAFKDVILAGREYNPEIMECVIQVCQLITDLKMWQLGYNHLIEEYGNNLSNGQRARVSLARSIYQNYINVNDNHSGFIKRKKRIICMDSIFEHMDPNVTMGILNSLFSIKIHRENSSINKYDEHILDMVIPSRSQEDCAVFITLNEPTLSYIMRKKSFQTDFKLRFFRISEMTIKEMTYDQVFDEIVSKSAENFESVQEFGDYSGENPPKLQGLNISNGKDGPLQSCNQDQRQTQNQTQDQNQIQSQDQNQSQSQAQNYAHNENQNEGGFRGEAKNNKDLEIIRLASRENNECKPSSSNSRRNSLSTPRICFGENGLLRAMEIEVSKLISKSENLQVLNNNDKNNGTNNSGDCNSHLVNNPDIFDENFLELSGHVKLESYSWYLFGFFGKKNIILLIILFILLSLLICSIDTIVILWSGTDLDMRREMMLRRQFDYKAISNLGFKYMMIFVGVTIIACIVKITATYIEINSILRSAIILHNRVLFEMIISPLSFFDSLDSQSLVNIFSMDLGIIDGELNLGIILKFFSAMASQGYIIWSSPICILIYPILIWYYFKYIFKPTRIQTRESYRFLLNTYGPLCNKTECNIRGSSTIRNMGFSEYYKKDTSNILYILQRTFYYSYAIGIWRLIRTLFCGILLMFVLFICPTISRIFNFQLPLWITRFAHGFQSALLSSFLVLSLTIIIAFPNTITSLITDFIDLEKNMCSVQRFQILEKQINRAIFIDNNKSLSSIETFSEINNLPSIELMNQFSSDKALLLDSDSNSSLNLQMKNQGLVINNIVMSYYNNSNKIFDYLYMSILPGEHIGLIGRTGSGKSSLFQCILGNYKLDSGFISLDGVNIELKNNHNYLDFNLTNNNKISNLVKNIPKQMYGHNIFESCIKEMYKSNVGRNQFIGYIPQNSIFIKNWRVRDYIDPFQEFSDDDIWKAVKDLSFEPLFKGLPHGLESVVYSDNYSDNINKMMNSGQCQNQSQRSSNLQLNSKNLDHINHRYLFSLSQLRLISLLRVYLNSSKYKIILVDEPPIIQNKENNKAKDLNKAQRSVFNVRIHQEKISNGGNRRQINIKFNNSFDYEIDNKNVDNSDNHNNHHYSDNKIPSISYLINKYFRHCIVIIIAHHMESIEFCDKVYIMGKGKIEKMIDLKEKNNYDNLQNIFKLIQN